MYNDKKFVEVLTEVVRELMNGGSDFDAKEAELKVVESLVKKGYELSEISEVLENIFAMINTHKVQDMKLRMIHPQEIEQFTEEARELIFTLRGNGGVEESEFEEIINHFSGMTNVDVFQVKAFMNKKGILEKRILN